MPRAVKTKAKDGIGGAGINKRGAVGGKKSKLYALPEKISEGTVLRDLSKAEWRIGPSIGTGGFGEIYSACRVGEKSYNYVVKCEPHENGPLFVEMHFYMRNAKLEDIKRFQREHGLKSLGMPYMLGNGSSEINGIKHRFIVMPRYGSDIAKYFLANGGRLPEGTAYRIAIQMLNVYEFIHSCGYVHADLKGANILLGYGKGGGAQVYLVDYGLSAHYTTKEYKPDPKKMHNGTIEYTSRDAHLGVSTMRGDMEILGYNLIEWLGVELPWVRDKLLAIPQKVQKAKEEFMANVGENLKRIFPKGVPVAIAEFMNYVSQMKYNVTPNYEKCRKIFANALKVMNISDSGDLDFKIKTTTNNNATYVNSKVKPVPKLRGKVKKEFSSEEDDEVICASEGDDDDLVFESKPVVKAEPNKRVKTTTNLKDTSPRTRTTPKVPKARSTPSPRKRSLLSISPSSASPPKKSKHVANGETGKHSSPNKKATLSSSTSRSQPTPLNVKRSISKSPAVSMSSLRSGKTIINDNITPNKRAGKTYEFNFELDVSMDANVIVNVKRKKKPLQVSTEQRGTAPTPGTSKGGSTPVTRVKVQKIGSNDDNKSPRTPAVTVKKSRRVVASPR